MSERDRAKVKQRDVVVASTGADATTEVSKISVYMLGGFGVLVGLWSLACLIGGMAASGGPLSFLGDWFKAVTGM